MPEPITSNTNHWKRLRRAIIISLPVLVVIAVPVWLGVTTSQREQLNADLIMALRLGQEEDVKSLLAQGADPNARDLPNAKPPGLLQQMIELFTHPRHPEMEHARTALSCATDSKHAALLVMLLLDKGASLKADEQCELPALFWAARSGDIATVKLLLDRGADVNVQSQVSFTPLQGAVLADNPELEPIPIG